jgi:hypothetical protein
MKELEVGDEVWVRCEVIDTGKDSVRVKGGMGTTWWTCAEQCRPVEQSLDDVSVVDRYCELVRSQSDFAWTIFANLSVMAQDAGAPSKEANERAADLMGSWFSLNIRESEQWKQGTVCSIKTKKEIWQEAEGEAVAPPPVKEPTEAQKLAERTMKAIWAANADVNERPPSVEPPPGLRWSPGDRVRIAADGLPFMRRSGTIVVALPTYCEVVLDGNGHTHRIDTNRLEQMREAYPSDTCEAEIKVEREDTPQTTTSKDYYGPDISKVTFEFTQTPNTLGTTDPSGVGSEDITIDCEYQLPGDEPFFTIRSDSGWSFDDPESFLKLLLSVKEAEEKCRCSLPQS